MLIFWQLIDIQSTHYCCFVKHQLNSKALCKFNLSIIEQKHFYFWHGWVNCKATRLVCYYFETLLNFIKTTMYLVYNKHLT